METISKLKIQSYLNDALNKVLEEKGIKIKDATSYDVGLDNDYNELLEKFEQHINLVIKVNKEVKQ